MKKMSETIVFFGSGPVAAASLSLLARHTTVEAVVTKPSTLAEMSVASPSDKIYTVSNKRELSDLIADKPFRSRLGVVIDFGIIISQDVIDAFELGIINSHFSLLPEWRGADPISFAILSGQEKTGVSLMVIDAGLDTGKIIAQKSLNISKADTGQTLTNKLVTLSDGMLEEYLPRYVSGEINPRSQPHPNRATYSHKLTKEDGKLDWDKPADQLEREIRAYSSWPKSRMVIGGKEVIITAAHAVPSQPTDSKPGDIDLAEQIKAFGIVTVNGTLWIDKLKPAGKKEMPAKAFLAGYGHLLR